MDQNPPEEIIQVREHFYVLASSSLADQRTRVLKDGDNFAVLDVSGDIQPVGTGAQGFYERSTRHISLLEVRLGRYRPFLLSSSIKGDDLLFNADLMNQDDHDQKGRFLPRGTLHVFRKKFLFEGVSYERLRLSSFSGAPLTIELSIRFRSDFADVFEIRGVKRQRRGEILPTIRMERNVTLAYQGLDGVVRRTNISFSRMPTSLTDSEALFLLEFSPKDRFDMFINLSSRGPVEANEGAFLEAQAEAWRRQGEARVHDCTVVSSSQRMNSWVQRSQADLHLMITKTPQGPYPYAGIPWFNTPFGRDGLITALQFNWVNPAVAKGVLSYLATTQAREDLPEQDSEPGKIMHETREGELVATKEVPFARYYGSADSTPLFLMLAGEYYQRTADIDFVRGLWPHCEAALNWIDQYGDRDRDGFVEYQRRSTNGLTNQGWKDSSDSISHHGGELAEGPIALCEIQAYVFAGKQSAALLLDALGESARAQELRAQAEALRHRFEEKYWSERLGSYALALDGRKSPCEVLASNAGHALFAGIATPERARKVGETLMSEKMFSGWGIRTLAQDEMRFNPMSYHNGSVWPHDTALIADGFSRYGYKEWVGRIFSSLFEASMQIDLYRLPELFCGFDRQPNEGPTLYPVACAPQAWSSGSVFMLLKACLGLEIDAPRGQVAFNFPILPEPVRKLCLKNLMVRGASVDLLVTRSRGDVAVNILRRKGKLEIAIRK